MHHNNDVITVETHECPFTPIGDAYTYRLVDHGSGHFIRAAMERELNIDFGRREHHHVQEVICGMKLNLVEKDTP